MWNDIRTLNILTRAMLGVLLLVLLSSGYKWVARQSFFDYRVIRVKGAHQTPLRFVDEATVRSTALPRLRGNFLNGDLHAMRAIFETVPWVHRASVRREWPNKLVVTVEEYEALGTWGKDDDRLLSVDGVVFTANLYEAEQEGRLLELSGPEDSAPEVAARIKELQAWLAPVALKPRGLSLSRRYAWTVELDNGTTLKLGREHGPGQIKARVERFVSVYPQLAERLPNGMGVVDMRYPNGLALRLRTSGGNSVNSASRVNGTYGVNGVNYTNDVIEDDAVQPEEKSDI